jgi:hypothetical protein
MNPKQLQLNKVTMIRCEACGELHKEEDCEIVIVKIIKGKECTLRSSNKSENLVSSLQTNTPAIGESSTIYPKDKEVPVQPKRKVIPPGFASMMYPDGSETKSK